MYLNLLLVYFLVGIWHGATWGFIVWGLLNGIWLIGENATKSWRQKFFAPDQGVRITPSCVTLSKE